MRKFKLLRSVPSLDQTVITFNGAGDVIYAILRRNLEDVSSAIHTRRVRHPLFPAFRTIDSSSYSEMATVQVSMLSKTLVYCSLAFSFYSFTVPSQCLVS